MAWKVDYEPHVKAEIQAQMDDGTLTIGDLQTLRKWIDEIESQGLERADRQLNDHPLEAESYIASRTAALLSWWSG